MRIIACIEDPAVIEKIFHPSRCESPEAGRFDTPTLLAAVYWADRVSQPRPQGSDAGGAVTMPACTQEPGGEHAGSRDSCPE